MKDILAGLLSFLLFLSLSIFSLAFALNTTILNPDFLARAVEKLDVSEMISDFVKESGPQTSTLDPRIIPIVNKMEPPVKEQAGVFIHDVYDYLLGKTEQLDLRGDLRETFLSQKFVSEILAAIDVETVIRDFTPEPDPGDTFTAELTITVIDVARELEPELKRNIAAASQPVADYLVGESASIDLAQVLRQYVLTPEITRAIIQKIAVSSLVSDALGNQITQLLPAQQEFLASYVDQLLPEISATLSQQISSNIDPILDYLLGQQPSLSVTIPLQDVVTDLQANIGQALADIPPETLAPLLKDIAVAQISVLLPDEFKPYAAEAVTDDWLLEQTRANYTQLLDYMQGKTSQVNLTITTEGLLTNLKEAYRQDFLDNPPAEYSSLPEPALAAAYESFFSLVESSVPAEINVDETILGLDLPNMVNQFIGDLAVTLPATLDVGGTLMEALPAQEIALAISDAEMNLAAVKGDLDSALTDAENVLSDARVYIGYFRTLYILLPILMALMVLGIIVLLRDVKKISLQLGTPLLIYGALGIAGDFVIRSFGKGNIMTMGMPPSLESLMQQLLVDTIRPFEIFSIVLLAAGIALVAISFLYRREEGGFSAD